MSHGNSNSSADTDRIKRFLTADTELESVDTSVRAVVSVAADEAVVAAFLDDSGCETLVTATDPDGQRVNLSCDGPAERVRELVTGLESTDDVADVTVTVIRVREDTGGN